MPLDTRQLDLPPKACFEDIAASRSVPFPELGKLYAAELHAPFLQPQPFQSLLWSRYDKESCGKRFSLSDMRSWCAAAGAGTTPTPHGALESSQRGLMIFDQSGNQTRLLRCPFPLGFPSLKAAKPVKLSEFREDHVTLKEFEEKSVNAKESEMHEDTEEINALLYSDDYDDDDDDCERDDDDEVMSTGHSPYQVCNKRVSDEIDNSPCKRQKLLDKVGSSSSLVGSKDEKKLPESNISSTKEDTGGSGLSNEQSRKDKIRTALKILESIVPGAKGNEALSLLDEAIDYLKLLKRDLISTEIKNHC